MAFKVLLEDALLYYTALYHNLDFVISRDRHFQQNSLPALPVLSPQEFIALNEEFEKKLLVL